MPRRTAPIRRTTITRCAGPPTWPGTQHDNIFISDGYCNNRVVKYARNGRFLAKVGGANARQGR